MGSMNFDTVDTDPVGAFRCLDERIPYAIKTSAIQCRWNIVLIQIGHR